MLFSKGKQQVAISVEETLKLEEKQNLPFLNDSPDFVPGRKWDEK